MPNAKCYRSSGLIFSNKMRATRFTTIGHLQVAEKSTMDSKLVCEHGLELADATSMKSV